MTRASRVKAWAAFLAAWSGVGLAATLFFEPGEERVLLAALAGLVAVMGLWRPFAHAGTVTALLAAATYVGVRYLFQGTAGIAPAALASTVTYLGTGLLANSLAARAHADVLQRRHDALLIEELTPTSATGAMKWQHAQRELTEEIARGRRYHYPVSLVLVGLEALLESADDALVEAALRRRSDLVRLLLARVRSSDRISFRGEEQLALVLPHTNVNGAVAFLDKHLPDIKIALGADPRIGLAEFPTDAGSAEELVTEAESALDFAKASGMRIVSRALLMGGQEAVATARVQGQSAR